MRDTLTQTDIPAAVLVDEDTLLLCGTADRPVPAAGAVSIEAGALAGRFHALARSHLQGERMEHWFLACLQVPGLARLRPTRVEIAGEDGRRLVIHRLTNVRVNPALLLAAVQETQPDAMADALDFLVERLAPAGTAPSERSVRLLLAFLGEVARRDGYAEIFGRFHDAGLLVQGWSTGGPAGETAVLVETDGLSLHAALATGFERPDLPAGANGLLLVLPDADLDPAAVRGLYHRGAAGWCRLDLFENRSLLPDGIAVAHLRDMLPRLDAAGGAVPALRTLAASRYEGRETVSALDRPVRMALDLALRVPGRGVFVTGWLLDPAGHVASVSLRGPGLSVRIDRDWARMNRRDVSEGFGADRHFAAHLVPGRDAHGFFAFAPEPAGVAPDAALHLDLELTDGAHAFLPVTAVRPGAEQVRRLLGSVNLNRADAEAVIARHVGPFVQAASRPRPAAPAGGFAMGRPLATPRLSVVVPVADGRDDIDLTLARLAIDPDFAEAEIVVAAGTGAAERLPLTLRRAAAFYRLAVTLVPATQAEDGFAALDAGIAAARADALLLLSPSVLPTSVGWLGALERARKRLRRAAMVSPTLLFEDESIRFAGINAEPAAPLGHAARYAGYPRHWPPETEPTAVDAASVDCALIDRRLVLEAGGLDGAFLGADAKGLDFGRRLRRAGHACVWVPTVALVALDEGPREAVHEHWRQVGAAVDRWGFAATPTIQAA